MERFESARQLIRQFKGDSYIFGTGVLPQVGGYARGLGKRAALVRDTFAGSEAHEKTILDSLAAAGVEVAGVVEGAAPNAPRQDLARITRALGELKPEMLISFGGGSTIDATKAAGVLCTLGGDIEQYFGMGMVGKALEGTGKQLPPHLAIETASSSGAHLTKYSNITDLESGQKKLVVDEAIVPARSMFDYSVTAGAPASLTVDGGLDGIAHSLEVLYSAVGKPSYERLLDIAREAVGLVLEYLPKALQDPRDLVAREALGLATDLGGYAIMIGGTNGAHLTSFSLVDILSHGRACGMLNPYYTVFFAPAVQGPLRLMADVLRKAGYADNSTGALAGRELGVAVAEALIAFIRATGVPATLGEVPGFTDAHIHRALTAAKNPQLKMKLENMPVPLTAEMVDDYMAPVLWAAKTGDLSGIRNVA